MCIGYLLSRNKIAPDGDYTNISQRTEVPCGHRAVGTGERGGEMTCYGCFMVVRRPRVRAEASVEAAGSPKGASRRYTLRDTCHEGVAIRTLAFVR